MPRQARLDAPGVLHHVMARGIERREIFRDDRDRDRFVERLGALARGSSLIVYAWSLMPNHFHLLVRTGVDPLSRSLRRLLTGYAGDFNRRHRRHGHLFQNRYKSAVCEEEPYLLELVRYLHLNPLRAGIVKNLGELDRYPYSGHSALVGRCPRDWQETGEILGRFGARRRQAVERYRLFVREGVSQGRRPELTGGGLVRSAGGWEAVGLLRRGREAYQSDERVLGSSSFVGEILRRAERQEGGRGKRVDFSVLARRIGRGMGVSAEALSGGGRGEAVSRARAVLCYVWVRRLGRSGRDLARRLGVTAQAVYAAASRVERQGPPEQIESWCSR